MRQPMSWGPDRRRAAVSLTFDNLGEAADIEFGAWPADQAVGAHFTATEIVPKLLDGLGEVKATFYVEAINAELYPDLLKRVVAEGHEVGVHGWRHELWDKVATEARPALLLKCRDALAELGLEVRGFRPPGGQPTVDLVPLLASDGFTYHSSLGDGYALQDGVVSLPFQWSGIDGFHLEPGMGGEAAPGEAAETALERLRSAFEALVDAAVERGSHLMLIFHPWISGKTPERLQLVFDIVKGVSGRPDVWLAPGREVADFLKDSLGALPAVA